MSRPIFLYDGDCAFCSSCARFIERRIPTRAKVAAWQFSDLAALGVTRDAAESAVQWIDERGAVAGPVAISRLLRDGGRLWRVPGIVLGRRPVLAIAWPIYRWIARNRHRLPGGSATCSLTQAEREKLKAAD